MKSTFQKYECQLIFLYSSPLAQMKMSELKGVKIVERYAKAVALLSPEMGEKTFSALFQNSQF